MNPGFSFLHPGLALGLIGVSAPIIIHFIFRRRARTVPFPAMRFVLLAYQKVARKLLVQEYLLLAARCLMAALLALAVAGPLWSKVVSGLVRGEKPLAVMFVFDTSLSMTRDAGGATLFDRARERADEWLGQLQGADRVGAVDGVRLTDTGVALSPDDLREKISEMRPAHAPARLPEAVSLAASRLADVQGRERMIIVFTDLQRTSWTGAVSRPDLLPPVYIIDMAGKLAPRNVAVTGLAISWKSLARDEAAHLRATIANFGRDPVARALVRVEAGGAAVAQGFVDIPAGQSVEKDFTLTEVPAGAGRVTVELQDGMTGDNAAWFHLRGGQEVRALVVDGEPGSGALESETYFLGQALNPRLYTRSRIVPREVTATGFANLPLVEYQVLVLANVDKLDAKTVERVKEFVTNGGGLLLTLGGRVNEDNYNAMWGDLLPRELRGIKTSYAGAQAGGEIRPMHIEPPAADAELHPILAVFRDPGQADLGLAEFQKYFLMQQEIVPRTRVILRLTDGAPLMVEGAYGRGKVIVFASTADHGWNDLCVHPTYLPLMQQTVQYLGNALMGEDTGRTAAGSLVEIPADSDVTGASALGPDGVVRKGELVEEEMNRRVRIPDTDLPGVYYVKLGRAGRPAPAKVDPADADRVLALNVAPEESDLGRLTPEEISARAGGKAKSLAPDAPLNPESPEALETKPLAGLMLTLLLVFALAERALTRKG